MARKGKFIVIEGLDSSGKNTQAQLIHKRLRGSVLVSFPNYNTAIGRMIEDYLHGRMGAKEDVPAEVASLLYAMDRYQFKDKLESLLSSGKTVVADRYTPSNLYQAAKLSGKKQAEFLELLDEMESGLPKPDDIVFLHMPTRSARALMGKRTGKKIDVHESDLEYQEKVRQIYLREAKLHKWIVIECLSFEGKVRKPREIASEIAAALKKAGTT